MSDIEQQAIEWAARLARGYIETGACRTWQAAVRTLPVRADLAGRGVALAVARGDLLRDGDRLRAVER